MTLQEKLKVLPPAQAPANVPEDIPHGDMPGDKIRIGEEHIRKANTLFPRLLEELAKAGKDRAVVSVYGGSGVGKSEIASLLAWRLREVGIGSYVISGDNYPRRIPLYNDAERARVFRAAGLKGLVAEGGYSDAVQADLSRLWEAETDPDPALRGDYPWLEVYQRHGREALTDYLGTAAEQDFDELNAILSAFRSGAPWGWLKRMGRTEEERWYSRVDFTGVEVLILEWTHGNSPFLTQVDIPILLNSTPEETREHRRLRARDSKTDSAFTTMVLEIEQAKLDARAHASRIAISKAGELLDPATL